MLSPLFLLLSSTPVAASSSTLGRLSIAIELFENSFNCSLIYVTFSWNNLYHAMSSSCCGTISWKHVQSFVCHNFQLQYTFQIFSWSLLILFWYYHICQTTLALKLSIDQITLLPGENKDHHGFQDQKFRVTLIRLLGFQTVQRLGGHQNIHIKLINHWFINLFAYYLEPGEHRWSWGHL